MPARGLAAGLGLALAVLLPPPAARAAPQRLVIDPAEATISFTLGATLHRVEGALSLVGGEIRFDPDEGSAAGEIVLDATSARTGVDRRDRNMHRDVLESERYPRIVFRAERLRVLSRDARGARIELAGELEMHGERHPLAIPARVGVDGARAAIDADFRVPYVDWGMRDPSALILRVDRFVDVTVRARARLAPEGAE